ncbi:putative ATP-dependent RNA helicase ddx49, partial [Quaeritorhiza haematococci]
GHSSKKGWGKSKTSSGSGTNTKFIKMESRLQKADIHLVSQWYWPSNSERTKELIKALGINVALGHVKQIHLLQPDTMPTPLRYLRIQGTELREAAAADARAKKEWVGTAFGVDDVVLENNSNKPGAARTDSTHRPKEKTPEELHLEYSETEWTAEGIAMGIREFDAEGTFPYETFLRKVVISKLSRVAAEKRLASDSTQLNRSGSSAPLSPVSNDKPKKFTRGDRLMASDAFAYASTHLRNQIVILYNLDIYFDDSLKLLRSKNSDLSYVTSYFLSRYEEPDAEASSSIGTQCNTKAFIGSHDAIVFIPPLPQPLIPKTQFELGSWGIENRLLWEFEQFGIRGRNPCFDIRSYHVHSTHFKASWMPEVNTEGRSSVAFPDKLVSRFESDYPWEKSRENLRREQQQLHQHHRPRRGLQRRDMVEKDHLTRDLGGDGGAQAKDATRKAKRLVNAVWFSPPGFNKTLQRRLFAKSLDPEIETINSQNAS